MFLYLVYLLSWKEELHWKLCFGLESPFIPIREGLSHLLEQLALTFFCFLNLMVGSS